MNKCPIYLSAEGTWRNQLIKWKRKAQQWRTVNVALDNCWSKISHQHVSIMIFDSQEARHDKLPPTSFQLRNISGGRRDTNFINDWVRTKMAEVLFDLDLHKNLFIGIERNSVLWALEQITSPNQYENGTAMLLVMMFVSQSQDCF